MLENARVLWSGRSVSFIILYARSTERVGISGINFLERGKALRNGGNFRPLFRLELDHASAELQNFGEVLIGTSSRRVDLCLTPGLHCWDVVLVWDIRLEGNIVWSFVHGEHQYANNFQEHTAKGEHVGAPTVVLDRSLNHFWRFVVLRALRQITRSAAVLRGEGISQAEVRPEELVELSSGSSQIENVARFNVTVTAPLYVMQVTETVCQTP